MSVPGQKAVYRISSTTRIWRTYRKRHDETRALTTGATTAVHSVHGDLFITFSPFIRLPRRYVGYNIAHIAYPVNRQIKNFSKSQSHFFRRKNSISATSTTILTTIITRYPYSQLSSGKPEKFMPYQPVSKVSGRKITVTTVKSFIRSFCWIDSCA